MRHILFDDDYVLLSLSRFTAPVQTITRTVLDIRIVQDMVGVLTDREPVVGQFADDELVAGALIEDSPIAASFAERETLVCPLTERDSIIGILED